MFSQMVSFTRTFFVQKVGIFAFWFYHVFQTDPSYILISCSQRFNLIVYHPDFQINYFPQASDSIWVITRVKFKSILHNCTRKIKLKFQRFRILSWHIQISKLFLSKLQPQRDRKNFVLVKICFDKSCWFDSIPTEWMYYGIMYRYAFSLTFHLQKIIP